MDEIRSAIAVLKTKSARKLTIISAILAIALSIITFASSFFLSTLDEVLLLNSSISAFPELVKERSMEAATQYKVYENDYLVRGELATLLYDECEELGTKDRLEHVRQNVNALDVTLLDNSGKMIASASGNQPSRAVVAGFESIATNSKPLYDPNLGGINEEMIDEDGYNPDSDSMPMVYIGRTKDGNTLMVELDYSAYGKILANQSSTEETCQRALSGMVGYAFMIDDAGSIGGYPVSGLDREDSEKLYWDTKAAFESDTVVELNIDGVHDVTYSLVKLLDDDYLAVRLPAPEVGYTFMIAVPAGSFASSMFMSDLAIIVLVVIGFFLFSRYSIKSFRREPIKAENDRERAKIARKRTKAGILVMLIVTGILTSMLLMLEGMSNTAAITIEQQYAIDYEMAYRQQHTVDLNKEYSERYSTRGKALADLLSDNPELRTRETLQKLSSISKVEYLMLFDKNGNELFSSNGYIGFSVNGEGSGGKKEWKPLLNGYEQVETPTEKNETTGQYERTIATLITDKDGMPDGFVLMVVNDDEFMAEIGDASIEGVIKNLPMRNDQVAAVVNNETGLFTAHTNESMIGESATHYLDPSLIGRDYEGYTTYNGDDAYISGSSNGGNTTLVISSSVGSEGTRLINWCLFAITLLVILFLFYPTAASLCARYVRERPAEKKSGDKSHPLMVFFRGYVIYVALLGLIAYFGVYFGFWMSFAFVYSSRWTYGIHLFSIWNALFTFAILSCIMIGIHKLVGQVDKRAGNHTKTFAHIGDSLATYVLFITMLISILTSLGVDTATIIGSVSIVSIAIGMGSQDLVKDILAGLFIISENTISVGDIVEIGGWRGRVTDMGIRAIEITNESNDVKTINNSRIGDVINLSKVKTACKEEFVLPRTVGVTELPNLVAKYIEAICEDIPEIEDSLELDEITNITEDNYTVRLSYLVDASDRESVTIRLRNAMKLLLETGKIPSTQEEQEA